MKSLITHLRCRISQFCNSCPTGWGYFHSQARPACPARAEAGTGGYDVIHNCL